MENRLRVTGQHPSQQMKRQPPLIKPLSIVKRIWEGSMGKTLKIAYWQVVTQI